MRQMDFRAKPTEVALDHLQLVPTLLHRHTKNPSPHTLRCFPYNRLQEDQTNGGVTEGLRVPVEVVFSSGLLEFPQQLFLIINLTFFQL